MGMIVKSHCFFMYFHYFSQKYANKIRCMIHFYYLITFIYLFFPSKKKHLLKL